MNGSLQIPLILASGSPRRRELLKQIDFEFEVIVSRVNEDFSINLPPSEFARYYARKKALKVASSRPDHLVIGADTIVVLDGNILGKPKNKTGSLQMLKRLSGRNHKVITGLSLQGINQGISETFHAETLVSFKKLTKADISYYINRYKPFDKAGSYGIQDWFAVCVEKIDGCFYNVMGFPLSAFYKRYKAINKNWVWKNI